MLGSIIGDIIGSVYEFKPTKDFNFQTFRDGSKFTDDTVLTIAISDAIINNKSFENSIYAWARRFPKSGYGRKFWDWMTSKDPHPYNSLGNGSAMRVSPVAFTNLNLSEKIQLAKQSAIITHNHPEGIKGALAITMAIHMALNGQDKKQIKDEIVKQYHYDLYRDYYQIQETYKYDITCPGSVPEALIAFFESDDYESAIRLAVSLGGDADTQACMVGGIAEAYYKYIPLVFVQKAMALLPDEMKVIINQYYQQNPHITSVLQ